MNTLHIFLLGMPSGGSWILIALAVLLLFGGKKIPELMKGLGGGIKEFKKASKEESDEKLEEKNK
ncbi:MAG: twin-arginine translocase TatA/TatE family subunit [Flavobacteriaceae bacterium]|nr:twin-arginine translocase TatA/TatE family subunit [Flavobacteriaceae bacterium]